MFISRCLRAIVFQIIAAASMVITLHANENPEHYLSSAIKRIVEDIDQNGRFDLSEFSCVRLTSSGLSECIDNVSSVKFLISRSSSIQSIGMTIKLQDPRRYYPNDDGRSLIVTDQSDFSSLRDDFRSLEASLDSDRYERCNFPKRTGTPVLDEALVFGFRISGTNSVLALIFSGSEYHLYGKPGEPSKDGNGFIVGNLVIAIASSSKFPCEDIE
ncbi:hypothetical protein [Pseudogemmobacter bohemicus]|uniref:hypothetical protein n=1 Tax=Pseudogemmobacter bohemicus TaxID=2250708 RepID=UPI0013003B70|nr:hypothetical protein [Pseudogemmobacter bohemicus]